MATSDAPITIKKYANRRLYDASSGTHTTLEALAAMVKARKDFVVYDAKGKDITRSVLTQIVFEQENKDRACCPSIFCACLSASTATALQMLVSRYLEVSLETLTRDEEKFRQQIAQAFGSPFGALEDQARLNMELFERAFAMLLSILPARDAVGGRQGSAVRRDHNRWRRQARDRRAQASHTGDAAADRPAQRKGQERESILIVRTRNRARGHPISRRAASRTGVAEPRCYPER